MSRRLQAAVLALALTAPFRLASAQDDPLPFDFGQTAIGRAGKSDEATVYVFEATTGDKVTFELWGEGHLGLTLYAPDGTKMLQGDGRGEVVLSAHIPRSAPYHIAVHRSDAESKFVLNGQQVSADLHSVLLALAVGLGPPHDPKQHSCWVDPGHIRRDYYDGGYEDTTIDRDGWFSVQGTWNRPVADQAYRRRAVIEGSEVIIKNYFAAGEKVIRVPVVELIAPQRHPERYRSYRCPS